MAHVLSYTRDVSYSIVKNIASRDFTFFSTFWKGGVVV